MKFQNISSIVLQVAKNFSKDGRQKAGFRFLTPYWEGYFKSHIRDSSTSTFADEFGCISSILASHTDFIYDLVSVAKTMYTHILTDMVGIQPTPDQYTAASEAFQQISCFCDTESFSEYMDEILKLK